MFLRLRGSGAWEDLTYFVSVLVLDLGGRPRFVVGFGDGSGLGFAFGGDFGFGSGVMLCETA